MGKPDGYGSSEPKKEEVEKKTGERQPEPVQEDIAITDVEQSLMRSQAQKIAKWGDEPCLEHCGGLVRHRVCISCWAELRKEAGL